MICRLRPVWRLSINSRSLSVEPGFSPTWLGGSTFHGRDLGGNFYLRTSDLKPEATEEGAT